MKTITIGGKILNRGYKGIVMDSFNTDTNDNNTLYNELKTSNPKHITLMGINENIKIDNKDIEEILKLIKSNYKKVLVKKFVYVSFFFGSSDKNFKNEIDGYKKLMSIFKDNISKYTTVKKGFTYNKIDIYGIIFNNNYYVFLEKCFKTLENIQFTNKTLNKCLKDIMETLDILNANDYIHNDIKPDNIILCKNRFKLIDWESSNYIKDQANTFINTRNGNLTFNHPIKFYRIGLFYHFYKYIYDLEIETYHYLKDLKNPKIITDAVNQSFNQVINKQKELAKIKDKSSKSKKQSLSFNEIKENKDFYLKLSDYFSFALILIYMAEKNKIDIPKITHSILSHYFITIS